MQISELTKSHRLTIHFVWSTIGVDLAREMIRRHHLIQIEFVEQLALACPASDPAPTMESRFGRRGWPIAPRIADSLWLGRFFRRSLQHLLFKLTQTFQLINEFGGKLI